MDSYPKCKVCDRPCLGVARQVEWLCLSCWDWKLKIHFEQDRKMSREYFKKHGGVNPDFYGTVTII